MISPIVLATLLLAGLVLSAVTGPAVLRRAAPLLMRVPRGAIALLVGGVLAWIMTLLAVGPVLAWVLSGPAVLPTRAAQVCEQCLAASNPFGGQTFATGLPVFVLLLLPAIAVVLYLLSITVEVRRRHLSSRRTATRFRAHARIRRLHGYDVAVVDESHPFALSLSSRYGGIVVSTGAVNLLGSDELAAVLAHEHAHVQQRHHVLTALVGGLTGRLRWVPLLAAAADALGHYLEIAADNHARRVAGTPALASALLLLGQSGHPRAQDVVAEGALHALGPDRIGHLVGADCPGGAGTVAAAASVGCLAGLTFLAASVHVPYAFAVLTGCV